MKGSGADTTQSTCVIEKKMPNYSLDDMQEHVVMKMVLLNSEVRSGHIPFHLHLSLYAHIQYACLYAYVHTYVHTYTHTFTNTYCKFYVIYIYMYTNLSLDFHKYIYIYIYIYIHVYIYIYIHVYIYIYIYMCVCVCACCLALFLAELVCLLAYHVLVCVSLLHLARSQPARANANPLALETSSIFSTW